MISTIAEMRPMASQGRGRRVEALFAAAGLGVDSGGVFSCVILHIIVVMTKNASRDDAPDAIETPGRPTFDRAYYEALHDQPRGVGLPDAAALDPDGGFWIFAYGSLLWRPGIAFDQRRLAALGDHERAFCLWSVRYRGTTDAPGLVLGVRPKPGAATWGAAYHVPADQAAEARKYLLHRELSTASYRELKLPLRLFAEDFAQGARPEAQIEALTYVVDVEHPQYAGGLDLEAQATIIASAKGALGANADYLFNTARHFREIGATGADVEELFALEELVRARMGDR